MPERGRGNEPSPLRMDGRATSGDTDNDMFFSLRDSEMSEADEKATGDDRHRKRGWMEEERESK